MVDNAKTGQVEPIALHHTHLAATDQESLRDWYIEVFGAEVADMAAFSAKMGRMGIPCNRGPERVDAINLTIAFIANPVGTYIEITEGLDDVE